MEWQPIETAPRDGEWVMIFYNAICVPMITFFSDGLGDWAHRDEMGRDNPTHWMPLPEPPK